VRESGFGGSMHPDRQAVLEGEAPVTGDVIRVRVRLEHADEPNFLPLRLRQDRLDRVRRIHDEPGPRRLVADEVGGAAQVVVQELLEQHGATLAPAAATYLEA